MTRCAFGGTNLKRMIVGLASSVVRAFPVSSATYIRNLDQPDRGCQNGGFNHVSISPDRCELRYGPVERVIGIFFNQPKPRPPLSEWEHRTGKDYCSPIPRSVVRPGFFMGSEPVEPFNGARDQSCWTCSQFFREAVCQFKSCITIKHVWPVVEHFETPQPRIRYLAIISRPGKFGKLSSPLCGGLLWDRSDKIV
jgi:hypothetical protein